MQHRRGKVGPVDFGRRGGSQRRVRTTSTGHAHARFPWLGRGRPKAPWYMCPRGHGGVAARPTTMGDERTTRERAT
jgi:hypothetical protein